MSDLNASELTDQEASVSEQLKKAALPLMDYLQGMHETTIVIVSHDQITFYEGVDGATKKQLLKQ